MSSTCEILLDNETLLFRTQITITSRKGRTITLEAVIDTGSTYTVLSPIAVSCLGLRRCRQPRQVSIRTVRGAVRADLYIADQISITDTTISAYNVKVAAPKVRYHPHRIPAILGMNFLNRFYWSYNPEKKILRISKHSLK